MVFSFGTQKSTHQSPGNLTLSFSFHEGFFLVYLPYIWTSLLLDHVNKLKDFWIACVRHYFRNCCGAAPFKGGNRCSHGYRGMDAANLGECDGLCRVGIDLCMAMAAIGEQG